MPGVLIDEQFQLDVMPPSSLYDSFTPQLSHAEAQQLMRNHSFSGINDASPGLAHSAPVYQRSQSAISSAAALQAFNYFNSPPTTPKKSSDPGSYSPMSMLDVVGSEYPENEGLGGLGAASASAVAMAISGNTAPGDFRSLAFGNSSIVGSPTLGDSVSAYKFLPSNNEDDESWTTVNDVYACDQFRMFEFKVRRCMRGRSHDWTECPFAHPGEKARRRDPRRFHYSGTACPDFRKGSCRRGDACEFAHGVFECWLHPARYRTQPCKDGRNCRRRVCFFAHTPEQLRLLPAAAQAASAAARTGGLNNNQSAFSGTGSLPGSYAGSPGRTGVSFDGAFSQCSHGGGCGHFDPAFGGGGHSGHCCASPQMSSPTSTLVGHSSSPPPLSPPLSPRVSPPMSPQSPNWASAALRSGDSRSFPQSAKASHGLSQAAFNSGSFQVPHAHSAYAQGLCSPLSRGSNSSTAMAPHAHNAQGITPSHRRHLDRLNSMPALAIPQVDHTHRVNGMLQAASSPLSSPSSCSPPSPGGVSSGGPSISELVASIHQLGLKSNGPVPLWLQAQSLAAANQYSSGPSPLRRCSQSVPSTPTKLSFENRSGRWEAEEHEEVEPAVQRVESGRDLRAKIYGKLGKESRVDGGEAPDLDWVNELVKDELHEQVW